MKKPTKWADPSKPICSVVKSSLNPERASSGPMPPFESCSSTTERKSAAKDSKGGFAKCWKDPGPKETLTVEADEPAWATQVKFLSSTITSRLADVAGVQIEHIEVRVAGSTRR